VVVVDVEEDEEEEEVIEEEGDTGGAEVVFARLCCIVVFNMYSKVDMDQNKADAGEEVMVVGVGEVCCFMFRLFFFFFSL
jgi:hypothetical protein